MPRQLHLRLFAVRGSVDVLDPTSEHVIPRPSGEGLTLKGSRVPRNRGAVISHRGVADLAEFCEIPEQHVLLPRGGKQYRARGRIRGLQQQQEGLRQQRMPVVKGGLALTLGRAHVLLPG